MLTREQLQRLQELRSLAVSGPWKTTTGEIRSVNTDRCIARFLSTMGDYELERYNMEYIVEMHNLLPELLMAAGYYLAKTQSRIVIVEPTEEERRQY